eukprot:5706755-Prymnesium_polylepis.1
MRDEPVGALLTAHHVGLVPRQVQSQRLSQRAPGDDRLLERAPGKFDVLQSSMRSVHPIVYAPRLCCAFLLHGRLPGFGVGGGGRLFEVGGSLDSESDRVVRKRRAPPRRAPFLQRLPLRCTRGEGGWSDSLRPAQLVHVVAEPGAHAR